MNDELISKLTKIVLDLAIFFEFSEETYIDEDLAVELLENISAEFASLSDASKKHLIKVVTRLTAEYEGDKKEFLEEFSKNFGLLN